MRNITKVVSGDMLSKVVSAAYAVLLIRGLSQEDYASFVVFRSVAALVIGLAGVSINLALIRYSAEHLSITGKRPLFLYVVVLRFQVIFVLVLAAVCVPFAGDIAALLYNSENFTFAVLLGLIGAVGMLPVDTVRSYYQAEQRYNLYIATLWVRQILVLTFIALAWVSEAMGFVLIAAGITALDILTGMTLLFRSVGIRRLFRQTLDGEQREYLKEFFSATAWLLGYQFFLAIMRRLDLFILPRYCSEIELATYGAAFQYYGLALMVLISISAVLRPRFARVEVQRDTAGQIRFLKRWMLYVAFLAIPIALADMFGRPAFVWINGPVYDHAYDIFMVFTVGVWLSFLLSPVVHILVARKAFKSLFFIVIAATIYCFAATHMLTSRWHGVGTAAAVVSSIAFIDISALGVLCWLFARDKRQKPREEHLPDTTPVPA